MPRGRKGKLDKVRCYVSSSKIKTLMEILPEFKSKLPTEDELLDPLTITEVIDSAASFISNLSLLSRLPQNSAKYVPQTSELIEEEEQEEEIEEDLSAYDVPGDDF